MGVTVLDSSCGSPAVEQDKVAFEGLLTYESRGGVWKERWFVLDSDRCALVKCATSTRQRSRSYNSVLGGDVLIKDVQPLRRLSVDAQALNDAPSSSNDSASTGLAVTAQNGAQLRFRTPSIDDETQWLAAVAKLSSGFTAGVGARLAERELLAGKFSLVRELGRGASGIVSLYTWQGKPFAIKKFVPQKARGMPNRRVAVPGAGQLEPNSTPPASNASIPDDIRREIALLKKASALPYVIQLYDVIVDPEHGQYYLVMEYMGGGAIAEWDAERKCYVSTKQTKSMSLLDEATVRRYTTHLLLGIQALHRNRLCHRDIKPENLMATDDRATCKIGDLGVAHYFREDANGELCEEEDVQAIELWDIDSADAATRAARRSSIDNAVDRRRGMLKSTKGTYQFLPPEALSGDAFCGFKADVWSIGVTLYALSFGYLPFYSNDLVQLFEKIERDPVVFPLHCQDDALKDLLRAILEKDPAKRITVDAILAHPWLHRNVNTKALKSQVRALKRSGSLTVADHDVGAAVSVLQRRFNAVSLALRGDSLHDVADAARASLRAPVSAAASSQYVPRPIASDHAELPKWLLRDTTVLATQLHYDWCRAKYMDGWRQGPERDDAARVHPCLLPMRELPDDEQAKNVRCVVETMRCVVALGCRLSPPKERRGVDREPLQTDSVTLSWEMLLLIDLLAENSHEVWADGYVRAGWTLGDNFDATRKCHPSLKPYMALDEHEKDLSRAAVSSVLCACICLGYGIACSRRQIEC